MIAKSRNLQGLDIVSSSNAVVGFFYQKQNDIVYYFQLRRLNRELLLENARLNNEVASKRYIDTFSNSIAKIPVLPLRDTSAVAQQTPDAPDSLIKKVGKPVIVRYSEYNYIPARVLKNSISNDKVNYITLNRGSKDGIKNDMAVVTGNGIVGRIANVSENYATAVSVLSDRKVSVRLGDGTSGFIYWVPGNPSIVNMDRIPIMQPVKRGDSIFSTSDSYFPVNIFIGRVSKIDTMKASNNKRLSIKLSTNFRNLQYVYVVDDGMAAERKSLERKQILEEKK